MRCVVTLFLAFSGIIGSEFLPHLDEGAIWARGTLANSTSLSEGKDFTTKARLIFASFPEVTKVVSQAGRPDDGTDTGGFGNTEYFVDLKPKDEWRPVFHGDKDELIAAMNREVSKLPGVFWNFSQPIEDNVDETLTGTKGGLAAKIFGDDLDVLEEKGDEVVAQMATVPGVKDLGLMRDTGQPNLDFVVDRRRRHDSNQRRRYSGCDSNRRGRKRGEPGSARRSPLRRCRPLQGAVPQYAGGDREYPAAVAVWGARIASPTHQNAGEGWRLRHLPRKQPALRGDSPTRCATATWEPPCQEAINKVKKNVSLPRATTLSGQVKTKARSAPRRG